MAAIGYDYFEGYVVGYIKTLMSSNEYYLCESVYKLRHLM